MTASPRALAEVVRVEARRLGFARAGVTTAEPPARYPAYRAWLAAGHHGEMAFMAAPEHVAGRADPRALLASATSVVMVGMAHAHRGGDQAGDGPHGFVARYARGDDYHTVLHQRLGELAAALESAAGRAIDYKVCVDTAPLLERELAERAGLGFVGKNTMLIAPGVGSYLMLGALLTDLDIAASEPGDVGQRCGSCRACLDACPTAAFPAPYRLDARRCISYLTIEHRGPIPAELRPAADRRIFGCDDCQQVCPYNAAAPDRVEVADELQPRTVDRGAPDLLGLLALGANQRRRLLQNSAMRRANRAQLLRNVCVALGNAGDRAAVPALERALADRSPLVRAHAAWALGQLGATGACRRRLDDEPDPAVRRELERSVSGK